MKKTYFFAAVASLSLMASCQKEESPVQGEATPIVFSASIDAPSDTKVSVDVSNGKVTWVAGDEITISDGTSTGVYTANSSGATTEFTYESGTQFTGEGSYSATYGTAPAAGVDQAYSSTAGELIYMAAPSTSTSATEANFTFTAQCGLLKLNLTATGKSIKRIYVIDESGNAYRLLCETAQSIEGGKDFYIALPEGTYTKYIIRDSEGNEDVKTVRSGKTGTVIVNNQINKVTFSNFSFSDPVYPESKTVGIYVAGIWWAQVNCGYDATNYKYGKLYQWGRKDGCGYSATWTDLSSQTVAAETEIQDDINGPISAEDENASYFYNNSTSPYDWLSTQDDARWDSSGNSATTIEVTPTKTTNDPCPTGWRVPTYYELNALKNLKMSTAFSTGDGTIKGYWFGADDSNKIFLPAAGYRDFSNGDAGSRGSGGRYWSSSVDGSYGRRLRFSSSNASMSNYYRANGFSVRCVQE